MQSELSNAEKKVEEMKKENSKLRRELDRSTTKDDNMNRLQEALDEVCLTFINQLLILL